MYPNQVYSAFSFIGFLMCSIPLPWHLEAWNTGTCLYMFWTALGCLNQFINSVVWQGNAINVNPIWCDISTRIIVATAWGIPAASLCINRRLYYISKVQSVTVTKAEKRREVFIDLAIGLGLPILEIPLHFITQGHRFNIFENVGCYPATYNTPVAYVLVWCPPILMGFISAFYATQSIWRFNKSRAEFNKFLSSYSNLSSSRYVRLMCLASIEILCTIPLATYAIYLNIHSGIFPYINWENVHYGFSRVDQYPALIWQANSVLATSLELSRWLIIVCAFIFFGFFGFADEAKKNYRSALQSVAKRVGLSTSGGSSGTMSSNGGNSGAAKSKTPKTRPVLPSLVHGDFIRHKGSISSLTNISIGDVSGHFGSEKQGDITDEKSDFSPTLSYGGLTLNDVGGTLADFSDSPISPTPSSGSSASSFVTPQAPAYESLPDLFPVEKANTHDIV